jgi:hypothetical protein
MRKLLFVLVLFVAEITMAQPSTTNSEKLNQAESFKNSGLKLNFGRFDSIPFYHDTNLLSIATGGGFNSPQFSLCDLNLDGIEDLVVFERTTNKLKTFINRGTSNKADYKYAPEYQQKFPSSIEYMAIMKDYNNDGKADIFTIKSPGLGVWKNVSDSNGLAFESVNYFGHTNVGIVDYITSDFFGNFTSNVYVLPGDIPAIEDIDGDGDLDILNFGVWGVTVEYHKNLSVELTGTTDTLVFEYQTGCFGEFIENSTTNTVSFGYKCKGGGPIAPPNNKGSRHAGSNMLAIDFDGDKDKDLILGDIGYNNLVALFNTGDTNYAITTSMDTNFPSYDVPADLFIFPAAYYLDVNNDGVKELIAAPNTGGNGLDLNNVWLYDNLGTNEAPTFKLKQKDFLSENMVDVGTNAYPCFADINGDGLQDLIIGGYGSYQTTGSYLSKLVYYKNTGDSTVPVFTLQNNDLASLSGLNSSSLYPAFADMDNDQDLDMVIGDYNGKLKYYENTTGFGNEPTFQPGTILGLDSIDVGLHATPQLVDLNEDGTIDLLIGERNGTLNFVPNNGTNTNGIFLKGNIKQNFGGISHKGIIGTGYTSPFAIKLDTAGRVYGQQGGSKWYLFVAEEEGRIFVYHNLEASLDSNFTLYDTIFTNVYKPTISMAEINGDSIADLIVGEYPGGLGFFFKGSGLQFKAPPTDTSNIGQVDEVNKTEIKMFPNPAKTSVQLYFDEGFSNGNLTLMGIDGKIMFSEKMPSMANYAEFPVTNYPNGNYILILKDLSGKTEILSLIISK